MARELIDIENSMIDSIKEINPTIDSDKGPIKSLLLVPVAGEVQTLELSQDDLRKMFTYDFGLIIDDDEAEIFAASFGISRPEGTPATCRGIAYKYSPPTEDTSVYRGLGVGSKSSDYTFYIKNTVIMYAAYAANYYNPITRRYEISVDLESYGFGENYELPVGTINTMTAQVEGIDGIENTTTAAGGTAYTSNANLIKLVKTKLTGISPDSGGSIEFRIVSQYPSIIEDIRLVYPKDRDIFQRATSRLAIDAYILGQETDTSEFEYRSASGGETLFRLVNNPVISVEMVSVNGGIVSYTEAELDNDYYRSARASYNIVLDTSLNAGDLLTIKYTYNTVIQTLQNTFENDDDEQTMFSTDILFREFLQAPIRISIDLVGVTTFNKEVLSANAIKVVYNYIEGDVKSEYLQPNILTQLIKTEVAGILSISIRQFYRIDSNYTDLETVELKKNEISKVSTLIVNVTN